MGVGEALATAKGDEMSVDDRIEALAISQAQLQTAMAGLVANQAAFQANFLALQAQFNERTSRIEDRLARIENILMRHEQMLAALPEAVRQRIGFDRQGGAN
jgi:hypothetical protein